MPTQFDTRRYLTDFDAARSGHVLADVLVIGSGAAGARAAIEAAQFGTVILLCKAKFADSASSAVESGRASLATRHLRHMTKGPARDTLHSLRMQARSPSSSPSFRAQSRQKRTLLSFTFPSSRTM